MVDSDSATDVSWPPFSPQAGQGMPRHSIRPRLCFEKWSSTQAGPPHWRNLRQRRDSLESPHRSPRWNFHQSVKYSIGNLLDDILARKICLQLRFENQSRITGRRDWIATTPADRLLSLGCCPMMPASLLSSLREIMPAMSLRTMSSLLLN